MEGLGSEVGNKMRNAVKAKLIELGSGTTAGYIDDELPDYVMIMVANKRSREQMTEDLSLFLGKNTEPFVSWLHQVLEKLQEVTLPSTASTQKSKRKASESSSDKRDKNDKRPTKPKKRLEKEKSPVTGRSTTPPIQSAPTGSITDVFADHLIQKARKVIEPPLSVKKAEKNGNDGFDIPTISEIAKKAVGAVVCRKEITELAELQKKIDQAKRQLRHMASESDDEDILRLGPDRTDLEAELSGANSRESIKGISEMVNVQTRSHQRITMNEKSNNESELEKAVSSVVAKKPSILERLGTRGQNENIISLSAVRRMEQAIYVPAHRRNKAAEEAAAPLKRSERERERERDRSPERDAKRLSTRDLRENRLNRDSQPKSRVRDEPEKRDLRERVNQRDRDRAARASRTKRDSSRERIPPRENASTNKDAKLSIASRIGSRVIESRVIVAPPKPDYDEDEIEVPVNSVVKVQPRPLIPKSKQACKNLLLRAVAEAQKSTALAKPPPREFKAVDRNKNATKLYTASYRKNLQKDNIVVEIETSRRDEAIEIEESPTAADEIVEEEEEEEEEEYVPTSESVEEDPFIYIPKAIHNNEGSNDSNGTKTQFVVTLDSIDFPAKKRPLHSQPNERASKTPPINAKRLRLDTNVRTQSPSSRVGKVVVKSEADEEDELRKEVEKSSGKSRASLKRKRTPIKFDIDDNANENSLEPSAKRRSKSSERRSIEDDRSRRRSPDRDNNRSRDDRTRSRERDGNEPSSKIRTSKGSSQKKYDNLPPLSSAITVTSNDSKLTKKLERCKFYPSCGRGERCEFAHPSTPCKSFPVCKYGDKCLYIHPKCKFDLTCSRLNCNFSHTAVASAAPPLSSHVVPVSNYKKIVASGPTLCRFYPNCSNTLCEFYHPKPCKYGKNCTNKIECGFYHYDLPTVPNASAAVPSKSKLKWVASAV